MKRISLYLFLLFSLQFFSQSQKIDAAFVYYEIGEYILTDKNKDNINVSLKTLDTTKTYQVKIISSADYIGTVEDNLILAGKRAEELKLILATKSTLFSNIEIINQGEISDKDSINTNNKVKGNKKNRKTTLVFLENISREKVEIIPVKKKTYIYNPVKREFDIKVGKKFILKRLIFNRGTTKIQQRSKGSLLALLRFLKENSKVSIEIQGHLCCNAGFRQMDKSMIKPLDRNSLSSKRASTVYKYLVRNGIRSNRLTYNGYGFQMPIHYPETSQKEKSINKRVEILITKIK